MKIDSRRREHKKNSCSLENGRACKSLRFEIDVREPDSNERREASVLLLFIMTLASFAALTGCAGYRLGSRTLFRQDIRTVHVPIIRSESFRPELGVRLTEAVQKEIEDRTPYKIVDASNADSTLVCRINFDTKSVMTETSTDEPRYLNLTLAAEVNWTDRIGNVLMENRFLPPGETAFYFSERTDQVPEGGQSVTTSQQRAIERMADHIVDQMEARW